MNRDCLTSLPNELLEKISDSLDFMSYVRLGAVCRELREHCRVENRSADIISYTDQSGNIKTFNNLNTLIEEISESIYDDMESALIVYPSTKRYSMSKGFTNHVLILNRNILFMEDENDNLVKKYTYSFCIRRNDLKIPEYENLYFTNNLAAKTSAYERLMTVPVLLFYIGVKVIFEIEGHANFETNNFTNPLPEWLLKILTSPFYPGHIIDEISNGSIEV